MQFINKTRNTRTLVYDCFFFYYRERLFISWLLRFLLFLALFLWESVTIFRTHSTLTLDWFVWFSLTLLMAVSPLRSRTQLWRKYCRAGKSAVCVTTFRFGADGFEVHEGLHDNRYSYSYRELERLHETPQYLYLVTKWRRHVLDKRGFALGSAEALSTFLRQTLRQQKAAASTRSDNANNA